MKFSAKTNVAVSNEVAFEKLTNTEFLASLGAQRGIEVTQTSGEGVQAGSTWRAEFQARRKTRSLEIQALEVTSPEVIVVDAKGEFLSFHVTISLKHKSKKSCVMDINVEARGENLQGRLLVQSAKLARNRITSGFSDRLNSFATMLATS